MPRGRKPWKHLKQEDTQKQKLIEEVSKEILGETCKMDPQEAKKRIDEEAAAAFENIRQESVLFIDTSNKEFNDWDVTKDVEITCFDGKKSYEITGYRPIDETHGLDFKPEWFTETREVKIRTGKYCAYPAGTKKYADFWIEQFRRCNEGYVSHGYRITGDHYFFLNFYRLKSTTTGAAGMGRSTAFPSFFSKQYEYFHYIDLCKITRHDVCALKARGVKTCAPYK